MIHSHKITALVPIKDHSERVAGKNFRQFCGKPLYHHVIDALHRTYAIDEILIDTDSDRAFDEAPSLSSKVRIVKRPFRLRGDFVSTNRIFEHDISQSDSEIFVQTHATNPLLRSETIASAIQVFMQQRVHYDSLFSVNAHYSRFYDRTAKPLNHDPANLVRTQDLPAMFEENSCLYVFTRESFALTNARIGGKPLMFETPALESIDIDNEIAWKLAETVGMHALSMAA